MTKGPALRSRRWTLAGVGLAVAGPPALAAVSPEVTGGTANLGLQGLLPLVLRGVGAGLATLGFALAHVPAWGLGFALTADLPFGIVMTAFYLWRRDLLANMLAHSAGLVFGM